MTVQFVPVDFQAILAETVATFESESGAAVPPASLIAILLRVSAYREKLLRLLINDTGNLCTLSGARESALDALGDLVGVTRLSDQPAACEIEFTWSSGLAVDMQIPAGTRVQSSDGLVIFAVLEDTTVSAGETEITVDAECLTGGTGGNDYAAGTISTLLDALPVTPATVGNLAATADGADTESDDHYRARIRLTAEAHHGTVSHYSRLALDASTAVMDVSVQNTGPGEVGVYLIGRDGAAVSAGVISAVQAVLDDDENRTLCDTVTAAAATPVAFNVSVSIEFAEGSSALAGTTLTEATRLITEWADVLRVTIGADIVPEEIVALCQNLPGVYRVNVTTPVYTVIDKSQVAQAGTITVSNGGEVEP